MIDIEVIPVFFGTELIEHLQDCINKGIVVIENENGDIITDVSDLMRLAEIKEGKNE